jgi:8-oxo-dGTP pyrophosphatase MutT (NUDIX family)
MQKTVKIGIMNETSKKYLMIKRDNDLRIPNPDLWDTVGGSFEDGESPLDAAIREKDEETGGIEIFDMKYLGKTILDETINDELTKTVLYMFLAKTHASIGDIKLGEGQCANYFSLNDIMKLNAAPHIKKLASKYRHELDQF